MTDPLPQKSSTPPIPANETERLAALYRYKILDTPPEAAFDRITALAARLFKMPIALVSLVDESRAWFKSCIGFDAREVPRDATLCSFAVLMSEPLIIPDTRQDERFACNPFVQSEPGVRFYAGAPLLSRDGFNLGTLCLLDSQPRDPLTAEQQATLIDLAAMVVDELELRLASYQVAQVDTALLEITQGVATVTGEAFFDALVQHFAKVLDADYAYIGLIEGGLVEGNDLKIMRTIATCAHGQIVDNLEYPLQDTPCWQAIEQGKICCYPRDVQAQFPDAPLLKPLAVESYVAIPFFDSSGVTLGVLGVMDSKPLEQVQLAESLLTLFALRVATELERQQAEAALRESEEKYRNLFTSMDEGFCLCEMLFDKNGEPHNYRFLEVNPLFEAMTGLERATGKTARELVPTLEAFWFETYGSIVLTGKPVRFEQQSVPMNRWFNVNAFRTGEPHSNQFAVLFTDITNRKRAEQERDRFLAVGSDLQVMTGNNGYFQWVSPTFERTLGWTVDEMIARPWTDFIHADDIALSVSEIDSLFLGNETFAFENRYRHKDGSYRWFLWRAQPYPEEQVVYGAAVDITELKQAEAALRESETRLRFMLNAAQIGEWDLDLTTQPYTASRSLRHDQIFGYESLLPNWSYEIFLTHVHPDDRADVNQKFQQTLSARTDWNFECRIIHPDQSTHWIWARSSIYCDQVYYDQVYCDPDGVPTRLLGMVVDITDRKQAEAERERLLQSERAAREEAERANRIKDEFLAVLSHELRSPLNPILGWSQLLQNGKLDEARRSEALKTIERNARLQSQMIEDLLDISRIMQGKLTLTAAPVSLTFVISAAVETVRLAAEAKNIGLQLDLDPTASISGDAARLQQVIWNLLTNAVKFTSNGGQITVELRQLDRLAQIRVIDAGIGIQPQFLPHVFEYFRQEDGSTTRRFGGLGLGLAIVRQIVELHGGTVRADSLGENQGAMFTVQLPILQQAIATVSDPAPTQVKPIEVPLSNLQILLVDDDDDTREFQAFVLQQSGAKVTAVASGLEALRVLDQFIPDLLMSDVGMAEMDGYMLIQQIRSRPAAQGGIIPALALTAYARDFDQQKALQAGFQVHLTKPVEPEGLVKAIVNLLQENRANEL